MTGLKIDTICLGSVQSSVTFTRYCTFRFRLLKNSFNKENLFPEDYNKKTRAILFLTQKEKTFLKDRIMNLAER